MTPITILKGMLFSDRDQTTDAVRAEAARRNLTAPNVEVACLVREKFTDAEIEAMGFVYLFIMHEPVEDRCPRHLCSGRDASGRWLCAFAKGNGAWRPEAGLVFAVA